MENLIVEPLRSGGEAITAVENRFHQRVAAADDIAHYPKVRTERELIGSVALDELDAERAQLVAHGRVHTRIAPRDPMAGLACNRRDTPHEGAANAENVNVHAPLAK